jgi:hypothetical protein
MITVAVEPPPSSVSPELQEYLTRIQTQWAGALLEAETEVENLKKRIKALESKP